MLLNDLIMYRKRTNIGSTFNLAIQHNITKLKAANILVHAYNVIETYRCTTTKLKFTNILLSPNYSEVSNISMFTICYVLRSTIYILCSVTCLLYIFTHISIIIMIVSVI